MKKKVYVISLILLIFDILSKIIIKNSLNLYESIKIIPNFFYITYVRNTGCAFSILEGKQYLLIILTLIVFFYLIYYFFKDKLNNYKVIYYSLLFSGILGNLFDRVFYNYVVDFLDFKIFGYSYPVFNFADSFIVIGVILIIIELIRKDLYGNRCK